jgi:hypothetical protein
MMLWSTAGMTIIATSFSARCGCAVRQKLIATQSIWDDLAKLTPGPVDFPADRKFTAAHPNRQATEEHHGCGDTGRDRTR